MINSKANMPLTLEQHFKWLAEQYPDVQDLHSLWLLLRKDLEDRLPHSRGVFVHYSLHDATHSRSVIRAIERFLGENRIGKLSATDTFMLLICAYAHDYGMAMTFNQIYDALGDRDFTAFLEKQEKNFYMLREEDVQAVKNLISYMKKERTDCNLQELYFSIMVVIQTYLRPSHWKGVQRVWGDFKGLLEGRLNGRFIQGGEGIVEICEAHGKTFQDVLKMSVLADGIVGDDFHPRFIAAMLRLGDLLDLDNGRFPRWFVTEISSNRGVIPHLSTLHYKKHEAISHLLVTPKRIEVCASCSGSEDGYEVAGIVKEWLEWLEKECTDQIQHWSEITQPDFGRPPMITKNEITLDGKAYTSENQKLQMRMSQDRVMKLLEGTSIYQNQYVGIRELVQNAVDASLLQLWDDVTHNRYLSLGISKHGHKIKNNMDSFEEEPETKKKEMSILELGQKELSSIFNNYPITIELIKDMVDQKVYITVKDKGTGITLQDAKYMSEIGASKERNSRIVEIMKDMPRWLKPSGIFGIGLQSVFQLTDRIEFYTRIPNEPERLITFYSYGRNHGNIEIREVPPNTDGIFFDNSVPGTNVKIAVDPEKLLTDTSGRKATGDHCLYYDTEFDLDDPLHAIFVELSSVIESELKRYPCNYFNIYFQAMIHKKEGERPEKKLKRRLNYSYFSPTKDNQGVKDKTQEKLIENTILPFYDKKTNTATPFSFLKNKAYYIDEENCRIYRFNVRLGKTITVENGIRFRLPDPVQNLYGFYYKFNPISDVQSIYSPTKKLHDVHAGFLYWNVNIMDDDPTKYLNIDRDRLREGAIMLEELDQVRKTVLERWCDHLIKRYHSSEGECKKKNKKKQAKLVWEEKEEKFVPQKPSNIYQNMPRTLISLALLFYQNVSAERFREFIEPYKDYLEKENLILLGENIRVDQLWEEDAVFCYHIEYPQKWAETARAHEPEQEKYTETGEEKVLHIETVTRLPHRLMHMTMISLNQSGELNYYFHLGQASAKPCAIAMDYAARLHDYSNSIEPGFSNKKEVKIDSLVNKVFKPNKHFPHLLVPKYPKAFKRGRNFSLPMDYSIRWYILSPFDREMTKQLSSYIFKDGREIKEIVSELKNKVNDYKAKSKQMEKCIRYVYKQRIKQAEAAGIASQENLEEIIRSEYSRFLIDCCQILIEQRELVKNQFKDSETLS